MNESFSFLTPEEQQLTNQFLQDGYVCLPVEDKILLDKIRDEVIRLSASFLELELPEDPNYFLNNVAESVSPAQLNALRLEIIGGLLAASWFRPAYFHLARRALEVLVGNELVMQRGIGVSLQLPNDESSLLNIHSDSWSGDSPFEVVLWLPLVDCYKTKSMYILPPNSAHKLHNNFSVMSGKSNKEILEALADDLIFLDVPYGHFLLFNHNLPHGNKVNEEIEARWSMNCRFKSVFSPYADKKLGEFFEPITLRAATRIGMSYKLPEVVT